MKNEVIINADYRLTIPKGIREQVKIKPGQKLNFELIGNGIIKLSPIPDPQPE